VSTEHRLKGVSSLEETLLSEKLEANLHAFLSWGLLGIGAFENVTIPSSGFYGGNRHRLRLCEDPNYSLGRVWEGARTDWVWESGIEHDYQPIRVSGVFVNGAFKPATGVGPYAHTINYPLGRVVFSSAIASGAVVTCEHSPRYYGIHTSDVPWFRQFQFNSMRPDHQHFLQTHSGVFSVGAQSRVQLPCVVIDVLPTTRREGYEIGSDRPTTRQDVLFHVFADSPWDRQKLHDILTYQWEKTIEGFDPDRLVYPLEYGSPLASGTMYPLWTRPVGEGGARWKGIEFEEVRGQDYSTLGSLYYCPVRATMKVYSL
jgi:hypothetical protein